MQKRACESMHKGAPKESDFSEPLQPWGGGYCWPRSHAGEHKELFAVGVRTNRTCIPATRHRVGITSLLWNTGRCWTPGFEMGWGTLQTLQVTVPGAPAPHDGWQKGKASKDFNENQKGSSFSSILEQCLLAWTQEEFSGAALRWVGSNVGRTLRACSIAAFSQLFIFVNYVELHHCRYGHKLLKIHKRKKILKPFREQFLL